MVIIITHLLEKSTLGQKFHLTDFVPGKMMASYYSVCSCNLVGKVS